VFVQQHLQRVPPLSVPGLQHHLATALVLLDHVRHLFFQSVNAFGVPPG
jgi:hypothetical protein